MKRTFIWKPIQVFFTALACLSIFSVSVSCASLPKSGRAGESSMQTENEQISRQSENREDVSELAENENPAENENVSTTHGNNASLPQSEKSGDSEEAASNAEKVQDAAGTGGEKENTVSTAENLSERVRVDLPEKSEEAMLASSSIDEPVVREGFSENTGKGSKARNDTTASRVQKEAAPKGKKDPPSKAVKDAAQKNTSSAQTSVNAAAGNTKRSGTEAAQKTKDSTSEKTINPAKSAADTQSAKDKDVGGADKSAKDSEALRKAADSLADTDEIGSKILPSRSVHIAKNQYLDAVYPGGGWIYLGEKDGTKLLSFFGKRLGDADTIFTLRAKSAGKSMLHFYKNDVLTGDAIDDWLEVIIEDKTGSAAERITAPSYADTVPPRPVLSAGNERGENAEADPFKTAKNGAEGFSEEGTGSAPISGQRADSESGVGGISASADESNAASFQNAQKQTESATALSAEDYALDESDLLEKAKSAYDEKNYARALAILDLFFARATSRIDEGLYLRGQTLEAKSALQNIKGAIGAYDELLEKWPESKQWQSARKRSIYLKRMYVDIR